ncbi:MAG: hypothetical protein HZB31_13060 [Nitrospirae bacterium]|nr:hypothetical protein [Nitrospirota bacterium]
MKEFATGKKVFLRNIGKDEKWLQDIIEKDPSLLPFENLVVVAKERKQSSGGRLDFLMKSTEEKLSYAVEIMLGDTDPSHIIRCIEYWDIEKRKAPLWQHYAVLVAESFNRRYFNVVQLLSQSIPMIAVQLDIIESENNYTLSFTKIMDIYEEEDDGIENVEVKEEDWEKDAPWVIGAARKILERLNKNDTGLSLKYTQSYIAITKDGINQYYMNKRAKPRFRIALRVSDQELSEKIKLLLENKSESYEYKGKEFVFSNVEAKENLINTICELQDVRNRHKQIEKEESEE